MARFGRDRAGVGRGRLLVMAMAFMATAIAWGKPENGNEFSLTLAGAKTPEARKHVMDEALGKPHFFRYLHIETLEEGEADGCPFVRLTTYEPSSQWTVVFKVVKSMSLAVLKADPPSAAGDAIAVSGVVRSVDPTTREIVLNPVIVRYKDSLGPKPGKELYHERDTSGVIYSFTGGKEAVNVSKRDEDLLQYEEKMLAERGKDGWAQFLITEIAKRDKAAKAARDKLGIYRKEIPAAGEETRPHAAPSVITDDE